MKAAVYEGNKKFLVKNVELPKLGERQVLIKINYSAICGTDVHAFMYDAIPVGAVIGHEYCGKIVQLGSRVKRWKVGDRVICGGGMPETNSVIGPSADPRYNYRTMGLGTVQARGYAEYVILDDWRPIHIPDKVSDESAVLCEPIAVLVHAVRASKAKIGDRGVVLGAGPIGLICVQVLKTMGVSSIIVSEPLEHRANAALSLGADQIINPFEQDPVDVVVKNSRGIGADIVFDCAGIGESINQGLLMLKKFGQLILVGLSWKPVKILPVEWMGREVSLQSVFAHSPNDWEIALQLLELEKVTVSPLITSESFIKLEQIQEAFERLIQPESDLQVIIKL